MSFSWCLAREFELLALSSKCAPKMKILVAPLLKIFYLSLARAFVSILDFEIENHCVF